LIQPLFGYRVGNRDGSNADCRLDVLQCSAAAKREDDYKEYCELSVHETTLFVSVVLTLCGRLSAKTFSCAGSTIWGTGLSGVTGFAAATMIENRVLAVSDQIAPARYISGPMAIREFDTIGPTCSAVSIPVVVAIAPSAGIRILN
jgi:hypothetical protein